jgi:3-methyl-2-oxobutanoate hydroxymethyltransferase
MDDATTRKLTVRDLAARRAKGEKLVALTVYDALMARMAEECGADLLLAGDSVGMTVLGYKSTIPVTLEQSLHHTAAVCRGARRALVIGDMPFMTYQINGDEALRNAGRFLQEAGADGVKLEGGRTMATTLARLVVAGVPVLGHIGLLPQHVLANGGYRVQGRTPEEAAALMDDAKAVEDAGAFALVLEGIPAPLAERITAHLRIPTIGIGAGIGCSGQIQVAHDILGLFEDFIPRHTRRYAALAGAMRQAFSAYAGDVRHGRFPGPDESFQ